MSFSVRTRDEIAREIAMDIPEGHIVNLGIGLPTLVSNHIPQGVEIILHSENGILGLGPKPPAGAEDHDLINAGKQPVTLRPGGSFFHHADSFAMMRGGHLDVAVLGAYQVSTRGDLANWSTGEPDVIPAVGGAMDLAVGAKQVWVAMPLFSRDGTCKIVDECSYPLTAPRCVSRIYTDHATFECGTSGLAVLTLAAGVTLEVLQDKMGMTLRPQPYEAA